MQESGTSVNRATFVRALIATAAAVSANTLFSESALAASPLQRGESWRFPGFILRAYEDGEGEIYLAYSAEQLSRALKSEHDLSSGVYSELDTALIVTNAGDGAKLDIDQVKAAREACDGTCSTYGAQDHQCFVVGNAIDEWVAAIDSGAVERYHDEFLAEVLRHRKLYASEFIARRPELAKDLAADLRRWHPSSVTMVDQLWTHHT